MKTFSWARYDSLRLDPEPGASIWDYEVEDEPEEAAEILTCPDCGFEAEEALYFDGKLHCVECFSCNLCPDALEAA